jgi:hypothetical protein
VYGNPSLFAIIRVTSWRPGQLPGWPAPYLVPGIVCKICARYQQFKTLFKVGYLFYNGLQAVEEVKGKVHPCAGTEALYRPYGP